VDYRGGAYIRSLHSTNGRRRSLNILPPPRCTPSVANSIRGIICRCTKRGCDNVNDILRFSCRGICAHTSLPATTAAEHHFCSLNHDAALYLPVRTAHADTIPPLRMTFNAPALPTPAAFYTGHRARGVVFYIANFSRVTPPISRSAIMRASAYPPTKLNMPFITSCHLLCHMTVLASRWIMHAAFIQFLSRCVSVKYCRYFSSGIPSCGSYLIAVVACLIRISNVTSAPAIGR